MNWAFESHKCATTYNPLTTPRVLHLPLPLQETSAPYSSCSSNLHKKEDEPNRRSFQTECFDSWLPPTMNIQIRPWKKPFHDGQAQG